MRSKRMRGETLRLVRRMLLVGCCMGAVRMVAGEKVAVPSVTFQSRDGTRHALSELRGHAAVVNFWATWCGPCKEEMPRLQKLAEEYAPQGVQFVAISLDGLETQNKIDATVLRRGLKIPVWTGGTSDTLLELKLGELVPATLVLDADGEVIGRIEGEAREKDVQSRLDWLLAGRQGKQPKVVQRNDW